jgi:site-specific DNA-methyltransferase (adenine-specific)
MPAPDLPLNQVIQADCLQTLSSLPEKSLDLVFADPPYNLQLQGELWRPNNTLVDAVDDDWDQFASFTDYDAFTRSWLHACRRVLKDTGTIWVIGTYHNIYRVGAILQDLGFWILNDIVWIKNNPMPNFRGVRFTNAHESLIWAQKLRGARYTFNYQVMKALNDDLQMRSDWHLPLCTGKERLRQHGEKAHTTQKPEALLYRILLSSTNPGDIVLDPFFGTGTTGAVASRLGRHWIGIERDPGYVELARQRISQVPATQPDDQNFRFDNKRTQKRVSLGMLLENGLLQPGQKLFFGQTSDLSATILANGHLRCNDLTGSIHQVGRALQNGPCNGWQAWYYQPATNAKRQVIDRLRQALRAANGW